MEAIGKNAKTFLCLLQKSEARKYSNFGSLIKQREKLRDSACIHLFFDSELIETASVSMKFSEVIF